MCHLCPVLEPAESSGHEQVCEDSGQDREGETGEEQGHFW